jgi:hypothetical protein
MEKSLLKYCSAYFIYMVDGDDQLIVIFYFLMLLVASIEFKRY